MKKRTVFVEVNWSYGRVNCKRVLKGARERACPIQCQRDTTIFEIPDWHSPRLPVRRLTEEVLRYLTYKFDITSPVRSLVRIHEVRRKFIPSWRFKERGI